MSNLSEWFPLWVLWVLLPWLAVHLYYDTMLSRHLNAQRKPGEPPPGKLFGFVRYAEIMRENARRFESGDKMARVVMYCDWVMAGTFALFIAFRIFVK